MGEYVEKFGKFYLTRWRELGNGPAIQFYNEAITTAPESTAAREAEQKIANLRLLRMNKPQKVLFHGASSFSFN